MGYTTVWRGIMSDTMNFILFIVTAFIIFTVVFLIWDIRQESRLEKYLLSKVEEEQKDD